MFDYAIVEDEIETPADTFRAEKTKRKDKRMKRDRDSFESRDRKWDSGWN